MRRIKKRTRIVITIKFYSPEILDSIDTPEGSTADKIGEDLMPAINELSKKHEVVYDGMEIKTNTKMT